MALDKKYRPSILDEMYGNVASIRVLKNYFKKDPDERKHSFLFVGPRGCGKTTLARISAHAVGAMDSCITEMDSASFNGIEHVRKIQANIGFMPSGGSTARAWILDECHRMSSAAQNGMLKMLEEPPRHVYFFLATTDPQKLIKTLKDRCTIIPVAALEAEELMELMTYICEAENKKISQDVLDEILSNSERKPRAALNYLDKCMVLKKESDMFKAISPIEGVKTEIKALARALMSQKSWKKVTDILKELKDEEPEDVRLAVLGYCAAITMTDEEQAAQAYLVMDSFRTPLHYNGRAGLILYCYEAIEAE